MEDLFEAFSSRVTRNLCVGLAPKSYDDINHIVDVLGCRAMLNVANEEFMIEGFDGNDPEFEPETEEHAFVEYCEEPFEHGTYKYIPLNDGEEIPLDKMEAIIEFANSELAKHGSNYRIYVHCHAGLSRSPGALAVILIGCGHDPDEVKKFLERNHPQTLIHPSIWGSIEKNAKKIAGKVKSIKSDPRLLK